MNSKFFFLLPALIIGSILAAGWNTKQSLAQPQQVFKSVTIGTQTWMAENLNVDTFRNGDTIFQARTKADWQWATKKKLPAWCYYNNDSSIGAVYGRLYNFHAVSDPRGLAPVGWHIPSGMEWHLLHEFLGGERGEVAHQLKSTSGWLKNGNGVDRYGFNAMPAGVRTFALITPNQGYRWIHSLGIWWSTNKPKNYPDAECFVIRSSKNPSFEWHESSGGYSVRCIKD